jgi:hypothetical protein
MFWRIRQISGYPVFVTHKNASDIRAFREKLFVGFKRESRLVCVLGVF